MTDRPTALRVEFETEPDNVDPREPPRFAWRVETDRRGAAQTAYRVVVGRDPDRVRDGDGDCWDSGRVESERGSARYDGPDLSADETYYWTVRVWNEDGEPTPFADPASFSTALADAGDWQGEWIGHQPGAGDSNGYRSRWRPADYDGEEWIQVDLGDSVAVERIELHPTTPYGDLETPEGIVLKDVFGGDDPITGFGFPDSYRVEVADDPDFDDATVVAERTVDDDSTGDPESISADATGRYVRVTATALDEVDPAPRSFGNRPDDSHDPVSTWQCFALSELVAQGEDGDNLAHGRPVSASSSVETDSWGRSKLVDGVEGSEIASSSPLLRTEFDLPKAVERARLHVAGVGYCEPYVDGERVGDAVLDPAWTRYDRRTLYRTYEVGDLLSEGETALGLWLGRGWFAKGGPHLWRAYGSPRARAHLSVEFEDGTHRTVATDPTWAATESPIVQNDVYDGETYDARRERDGWAEPGFDASDWSDAAALDGPGGTLRPARIEPMRVVETFEPIEVVDHEDGPILDFGQNLTGWVELTIRDPDEDDRIAISHAETLTEDGDLSTEDLRSADPTDEYVARGEDAETYEPRFTYHGFRYAQVESYPGDLDPADVTAKVVHTAMDRRGEFDCANEDLRQVQHNAVWGLRGNTHSIPEDCPQRDERLGWTGDAHISGRALFFNYDAVRFQEKWMRDHDDVESELGYVGDVIPNQAPEVPADPTWSITRVMIPWYCYLHDGDRRALSRHYEGMRRYVDYWHGVSDEGYLGDEFGKYGDWLAFENTDGRRGLPHDLYNTAFHYQVTATLARAAEVLGNDADAEYYGERAETVAETFNDRFFDADAAEYGPGTQSSYAVPLFLGLVPDDHEDRVAENLVEKVHGDGDKLQTGFLGSRPLVLTLAEHGYGDLAYEVVSQPEQPGWVYMARNGATTMWEHWDSDEQVGSGMNSLNHSPFTFVSEFFYEVLAGIRLREGDPITDAPTIDPCVVDGLDWVEGSVETPTGELASAWERTDDELRVDVTVPWNATATVRIPADVGTEIREDGTAVWTDDAEGPLPEGIADATREGDAVAFEVGSGSYSFEVDR